MTDSSSINFYHHQNNLYIEMSSVFLPPCQCITSFEKMCSSDSSIYSDGWVWIFLLLSLVIATIILIANSNRRYVLKLAGVEGTIFSVGGNYDNYVTIHNHAFVVLLVNANY